MRAIFLPAACFALLSICDLSRAADAPPIAESPVVTAATPGHAVQMQAEISGAGNLFLVVTDAGDGYGCDWANWAEPVLSGPTGKLKLTDLKWKSAQSGWGQPGMNRNADGKPMRIAGKPVEFGIGTHANSVIHFELPPGFDKFSVRAALDDGGTNQNGGTVTSVQFQIFTSAPRQILAAGGSNDRTPETAIAGLDVADDLEVNLFAAEPVLLSPSNIDVDHLGRVWVCEVVNYRRFANPNNPDREEGDRILILEDTNGDGLADKQTTFYQGRDIDSAHGVCVLGNRVIVSAGDSVFCLYDDDGDLKADRKEVLFTGIKGTQHDHGIHSFTFGPDGRLYFNFGNSGEQLCLPDGSIVKDLAGNEVRANRQPYQEGMAFRCELDGSKVDTLGWNFRNNWELCVDSFGSVWQSDNDDDGNRSVRINYVMEYGNYGYKDELTGAGWREPRTNLETEIPLQHWHLNDPGVVPNLLQTGAGSPTGILIYEGDKLPERFINQLIHCDAGPNVVRSYAVSDHGAGYQAEINDILTGSRDQWFRPSDVCVAPDGSLIVADWYDPGVGGHRQGDVDRGRLFRVSLPNQPYRIAQPDFTTIEGAAEALKSPNVATRYLAFQKLRESGADAEPTLARVFESDPNPRFRARALWLLGQIDGKTQKYVDLAIVDNDSNIRITGLRLARRMELDVIPVVEQLVKDQSPQVRRECAIALRHVPSEKKAPLWAQLAIQHVRGDRWSLEALGISATDSWNECLTAVLVLEGSQKLSRSSPEYDILRELIWRSRSSEHSPELITSLIREEAGNRSTGSQFQSSGVARLAPLFRSLDFQDRTLVHQQMQKLISRESLAQIDAEIMSFVLTEALRRIDPNGISAGDVAESLNLALEQGAGTSQFVQLISRFRVADRYPELLKLAQEHRDQQIGVEAIAALLELKQWDLLTSALQSDDTATAIATAEVLGNSSNGAISGPLLAVVNNADIHIDVRRAAVRAAARVNNAAMQLVKLVSDKQLDPELTQTVAAALHASPARPAREQAMRLFPLPPSKDNVPTPPISELMKLKGDVTNGRLVFFTNGTCHKCHVVSEMGREFGPNLTEIGSKLSREAMFESVLYPSAGISHNYEAWTAVLTSGTTLTGLLTSQTDDSVSIRGDDAIVRTFPRSEIEELVKQKISLMPADLQKTMTTQELADVVEYMQSLKKK